MRASEWMGNLARNIYGFPVGFHKNPIVRVLLYWRCRGRTGLSPLAIAGISTPRLTVAEAEKLLNDNPLVGLPFYCGNTNLPIYAVKLSYDDQDRPVLLQHDQKDFRFISPNCGRALGEIRKIDVSQWTMEEFAAFSRAPRGHMQVDVFKTMHKLFTLEPDDEVEHDIEPYILKMGANPQ